MHFVIRGTREHLVEAIAVRDRPPPLYSSSWALLLVVILSLWMLSVEVTATAIHIVINWNNNACFLSAAQKLPPGFPVKFQIPLVPSGKNQKCSCLRTCCYVSFLRWPFSALNCVHSFFCVHWVSAVLVLSAILQGLYTLIFRILPLMLICLLLQFFISFFYLCTASEITSVALN